MTPTLDPGFTSEAGIPAHSAIAVDGEVVAYDSYGCMVVQDFGNRPQTAGQLDATLSPVVKGTLQQLSEGTTLRVAGRLLAYRKNPPGGEGPASVVIYDIDTGGALSGPAARAKSRRSICSQTGRYSSPPHRRAQRR